MPSNLKCTPGHHSSISLRLLKKFLWLFLFPIFFFWNGERFLISWFYRKAPFASISTLSLWNTLCCSQLPELNFRLLNPICKSVILFTPTDPIWFFFLEFSSHFLASLPTQQQENQKKKPCHQRVSFLSITLTCILGAYHVLHIALGKWCNCVQGRYGTVFTAITCRYIPSKGLSPLISSLWNTI